MLYLVKYQCYDPSAGRDIQRWVIREKRKLHSVCLCVCSSARSKNRCSTACSVLLSKHYTWHVTPDAVHISPLRATTPATVGSTDAWLCCWKITIIYIKLYKTCKMTQTWVLLLVSAGLLVSGTDKSWLGVSPSMMNRRSKNQEARLSSLESFSFSQRWVLITGILPSVPLYRLPLCQRCPTCDVRVRFVDVHLQSRSPDTPALGFVRIPLLLYLTFWTTQGPEIVALTQAQSDRPDSCVCCGNHGCTHTRTRTLGLKPDLPLRQTDADQIESPCLFLMISKVQWATWL